SGITGHSVSVTLLQEKLSCQFRESFSAAPTEGTKSLNGVRGATSIRRGSERESGPSEAVNSSYLRPSNSQAVVMSSTPVIRMRSAFHKASNTTSKEVLSSVASSSTGAEYTWPLTKANSN